MAADEGFIAAFGAGMASTGARGTSESVYAAATAVSTWLGEYADTLEQAEPPDDTEGWMDAAEFDRLKSRLDQAIQDERTWQELLVLLNKIYRTIKAWQILF